MLVVACAIALLGEGGVTYLKKDFTRGVLITGLFTVTASAITYVALRDQIEQAQDHQREQMIAQSTIANQELIDALTRVAEAVRRYRKTSKLVRSMALKDNHTTYNITYFDRQAENRQKIRSALPIDFSEKIDLTYQFIKGWNSLPKTILRPIVPESLRNLDIKISAIHSVSQAWKWSGPIIEDNLCVLERELLLAAERLGKGINRIEVGKSIVLVSGFDFRFIIWNWVKSSIECKYESP